MPELVKRHHQLRAWQDAFAHAMEIFQFSKSFPKEETYSLTDQIRRSSRSVTSNVAEAWEKRRYEAAFIAKLVDASAEAAETQTWMAFAVACGYLEESKAAPMVQSYDKLLRALESMRFHASDWCRSF